MANEGIEVEVYRFNDPFTYVTTLHGRMEPQFLREISANGGGSIKIPVKDPQLVRDPTLLDYRNVLKFRVDGKIIGAMLIENKVSTTIGEGEKAQEIYTVNGVSLKAWFDDAIVQPYKGLKEKSGDTRYFNFAAVERGQWYNTLNWHNVSIIAPVGGKAIKGAWPATIPKKWPAKSFASWVWGTNYTPATGAPANGVSLFRFEFTPTATFDYVLYVAGDDYMDVWIDGDQVVKTDLKSSASQDATRIEITLTDGPHVIAARVQNKNVVANNNIAGFALTLCKIVNGKEVPQSSSGGSGWKASYNPTTIPGFSTGEVLLQLMDEAEARGVVFPTWLEATFTTTEDSDGETWANNMDWEFDIGESLSSVISKLEELGCYIWIDPEYLLLNMTMGRGNKRDIIIPAAGGNPIQVPVIFAKGKNLLKAETQGRGKVKNSLAVKTDTGWLLGQKAQTSIDKYGVIEALFDTGATADVSKSLVPLLFTQKSTPEEGATYDFVVTDGNVPFVDFEEGDYVLAPNDRDVQVSRRIMSITLTEDSKTGAAKYTVEFDTIFQSKQDVLDQWVKKASGGGSGNGFANTAAGKTKVSSPINVINPGGLEATPEPPQDVTVSSVGSWSADGVSPQAIATIDWTVVTENTDNTDADIEFYEVWASPSGADGWNIYATVTTNTAVIGPVPAGGTWEFKVRAATSPSAMSDFSATINHTMATPNIPLDPPTDPTLSSTMGVLQVYWDGKLSGSGIIDPPPQFRYVFAEVATHGVGDWQRMGPVLQRGGGTMSISGLVVGTDYDVRLRSADGVQIVSVPSGIAHTVLTGVDLGDLDASIEEAIQAAHDAAIAAASTTNQVLDPSFEDVPLVYWNITHSGVTQDSTSPRTGAKVMKIVAGGGSYQAFSYTQAMPVDVPEQYLLRAYGRAAASGTTDTSDIVLGVMYGSDPGSMTTYQSVAPIPDNVDTGWVRWSGVWVVPDGAKWMVPVVVSNATAGETYYVDDFSVLKQIGNGLIVDGAITAEKVAAGAIVAGALAAGSVTAESIQAEAITAEKLAADSVTANSIAAGSITGDNIAAGTITAINLDAGIGGELDISANESVTIIAGQVTDVQAGVDGANDTIQTMQTYYSFGPTGAVISTPDSPFALALRADRIEMLENGNVVSYWTSGQMFVADFVGERVLLGNHQIEKYGTGTVVRAV